MKVYLLRHGQTEYNVDKRYQGTRDIPLSEKGRAALRRADIEPDTVYVSPLCRAAVDTARCCSRPRGSCPCTTCGRCASAFSRGAIMWRWSATPIISPGWETTAGPLPGGESRAEFSDRTCAAFASLVDERRWRGARKCSSSWRTAAPRWR